MRDKLAPCPTYGGKFTHKERMFGAACLTSATFLLIDMAVSRRNYGILLGLYINNFEAFPFKEWVIYMDTEEREAGRLKLFENSIRFQKAWDAKDPRMLPHVFYDNTKNWLCRDCQYLEPCQKMGLEELKKGALKPCEPCGGRFTHKDNCPTISSKKKQLTLTEI